MQRFEFEKLVKKGIKAVPKEFRKKLQNLAIVIEDEPSLEQLKKLRISKEGSLFGLYEGVPQTKRGNYGMVLPDKITIFQKPIEAAARDEKDIKEMVKNTVWHEIAHHFGMGEVRVRQAEIRRKRNNSKS